MTKSFSRSFSGVCIGVFVLGVATYSAFSFQRHENEKVEPARAFRLTEIESELDAAGVETLLAVRTKDVDANGDWHSAVQPIGKSGGVDYSRTSEGLSVSKGQERTRLDEGKEQAGVPELMQKSRTVGFYKNHPDLVGTDTIAGLEVYRLRRPLDGGNGWMEMENSPKTGHIPLRVILHKPDGSEHKIEAVKVEFK